MHTKQNNSDSKSEPVGTEGKQPRLCWNLCGLSCYLFTHGPCGHHIIQTLAEDHVPGERLNQDLHADLLGPGAVYCSPLLLAVFSAAWLYWKHPLSWLWEIRKRSAFKTITTHSHKAMTHHTPNSSSHLLTSPCFARVPLDSRPSHRPIPCHCSPLSPWILYSQALPETHSVPLM